MKQIQLELSLDDTNLILEGLGNLPFIKVHQLINTIHSQANAQVTDPEAENEENQEDITDNVTLLANEK